MLINDSVFFILRLRLLETSARHSAGETGFQEITEIRNTSFKLNARRKYMSAIDFRYRKGGDREKMSAINSAMIDSGNYGRTDKQIDTRGTPKVMRPPQPPPLLGRLRTSRSLCLRLLERRLSRRARKGVAHTLIMLRNLVET